jgi:hypothetical protein
MTPKQIQKKLEVSGGAWIDRCEAEARKKVEVAFKDAEARGLPGIDQTTFDGIMEDLIKSSLFGLQHMVLLTVCPHVKTSPTVRTNL